VIVIVRVIYNKTNGYALFPAPELQELETKSTLAFLQTEKFIKIRLIYPIAVS
jgi:hypothetical protein